MFNYFSIMNNKERKLIKLYRVSDEEKSELSKIKAINVPTKTKENKLKAEMYGYFL